MKKILIAAGLIAGIGSSSFAQNYISGIVSLHGDNTASGTTIVANGASLYFNSNKLYALRSFINRGDSTAIIADSGTLVLSGRGVQGITGRFRISALEIDNASSNAGIVSNVNPTMVTILDSVSFGNVDNAAFDAGDNLLTLRSNAAKTARIADLTHNDANSGNAVSGKVIVERFIRSRRAWRLLGPPTTADSSNDQTISEAWQEGARAPRGQIVDPNPGYGTVITRPGSDPVLATGYDDGVVGTTGYSMHTYQSNGLFTQPPNTDLTHFSPHAAYFLFVRGDRSVSPAQQAGSVPTPSVITTLRSKGALHNGDIVNTVTKAAGDYAGVANPYACTVDFSQVALNGIMNGFYTWDPSLSQLGAWVYIDGDDNYNSTPSTPGGAYNNPATNALLQSGQAIVVKPIGSSGTVTFKEKNKNITSRADVFRQVPLPALTISLFRNDSTQLFVDGTTTVFDASFSSSALPDEDITKPTNLNENLSFYATGQYLMKGKNPLPLPGDTLPLRLWRTSARQYSFDIGMKSMGNALQPYLLDNYTKSSTSLQTDGKTTYDFTITSDEASKAIDRFAVVFGAAVLPVTLTQIKADWDGTNVNVQWNVQNETGIAYYEVERSADGILFTKTGTVAAHNNSAATDTYHFADARFAEGDNFYRIKIVSYNGSYTYTSIAAVSVPVGKTIFVVYPNPVKNGLIKLWFKNAKPGMYQVQLYSTDGKTIVSKAVSHPGGTVTYTLPAGTIAQGLYHAVIKTKEGGIVADLSVMID